MIDEKRIKRFIEGAKEAFKEVDDPTFTFPMNILSAYELATSMEELLKTQEADKSKYEYHTDHTDCPWYISGEESKCPVTCSQYRDGWNDAMNYIFRNGDGYRPYDRIRKGGEVEWIGKPQSSGLSR